MDLHTATEISYNNGYVKGYADGLADKWISVNARLPMENTLCIYFTPYEGDMEWDMGVVCFRDAEHFMEITGGATHWMPVPSLPKGK